MKEILGSKGNYLKGKLIVLGVCGSIAAVRSFDLCRELIRRGASVQFVVSEAAFGFVGEQALEFASGKKVISRLTGKSEHVKLFGKNGKADLFLIAPATANTISKIAMGIDDTVITTMASIAIGSKKPVLIAPAMHEPMYEHPIVQENLKKLEGMNRVRIIAPLLAEEKAKMQEIEEIVLEVERALTKPSLEGKTVVVASGANMEEIDQTKVFSTKSSGKTGVELAKEAFRRGAQVKLIHNTNSFAAPIITHKVSSFSEFSQKTLHELSDSDLFLCPAALSDFSVKKSSKKIKSDKSFSLEFTPNQKFLQTVRQKFPKLFIVGFKAETNANEKELESSAKDLLKKNNLDLVVANDVEKNPVGFDENTVLIVSSKNTVKVSGKKELIAQKIFDECADFF